MAAHHVLTVLYGLSGFISLAGYVPQFLAFRRDPDACKTTPVTTWALWWVQASIVAVYAVRVNGDPMFMLAAGLSLAAISACGAALLLGRNRPRLLRTRKVDQLARPALPADGREAA